MLPPPGNGWYVGDRTPESVSYRKDTGTPERSFIATAAIRPMPDTNESPRDYLAAKQREIEQLDSARYRVLEQAAALDNRVGEFCVRYQIRAEDRGKESVGTPEQQAAASARWLTERPPVLDMHGVRCLHPNAPHYEVEAAYSQRGKGDVLDASLAAEGEAFVGSLHFAPLK